MSSPIKPSPKPGTVIVTGGAGLIGSALVWALNQRGQDNILIVDRLTTSEKWRHLPPLRFVDYLQADDFLARVEAAPAQFGTVVTLFHLGACSSTIERDAAYLISNNFEFTKKIGLWAVSRRARFIYASSAATYGNGAQGMDDKEENLARLRPLNMYGYSKHLFDVFAQRTGMLKNIIGLKFFNVFGPNEDHKGEMRSVVAKAYEQIVATGRISLFKSHRPEYEDGKQMRDFLYVKDAVEMTLHLADRPLAGGIYNIGSGDAHTWLELAHAIFGALGRDPVVDFVDMPDHLREKYQYFTCADIGKLRATGYSKPITPLPEAVRDYVVNYLFPGKFLGDPP
ncbi:MAG: ADP-glyceromanno-heptose 6-epimerase [Verrucomicrobiales bacterium]